MNDTQAAPEAHDDYLFRRYDSVTPQDVLRLIVSELCFLFSFM